MSMECKPEDSFRDSALFFSLVGSGIKPKSSDLKARSLFTEPPHWPLNTKTSVFMALSSDFLLPRDQNLVLNSPPSPLCLAHSMTQPFLSHSFLSTRTTSTSIYHPTTPPGCLWPPPLPPPPVSPPPLSLPPSSPPPELFPWSKPNLFAGPTLYSLTFALTLH